MSRGGRPCVPYGAEDDVLCGVCKDKIRYDNLARHFRPAIKPRPPKIERPLNLSHS